MEVQKPHLFKCGFIEYCVKYTKCELSATINAQISKPEGTQVVGLLHI